MRVESTLEMAGGEDRRPPSSALSEMGQPVAIVSRSDGRIQYVNPACERLFGYDPGALDDHHLSELSAAPARSPGDRARTIARELATAGVWSGDTEGVRADGSTFPCIVSLSEITGDAPEDRVWIAVFVAGHQTPAQPPGPRFRIGFDPARTVVSPPLRDPGDHPPR
jgi:PAS domain S-box-containing protein